MAFPFISTSHTTRGDHFSSAKVNQIMPIIILINYTSPFTFTTVGTVQLRMGADELPISKPLGTVVAGVAH